MPSMIDQFQSFIDGFRLVDGGELKKLINELYLVTRGIKASPVQTQAAATQLAAGTSVIEVVATSGDTVKLPPSVLGRRVTLINAGGGGQDLRVYTYEPSGVFLASAFGLNTALTILGATGSNSTEVVCIVDTPGGEVWKRF